MRHLQFAPARKSQPSSLWEGYLSALLFESVGGASTCVIEEKTQVARFIDSPLWAKILRHRPGAVFSSPADLSKIDRKKVFY